MEEIQAPKTAAELAAEHAERLRPKRQPISNDFLKNTNDPASPRFRWNGVVGGPAGRKVQQ